MKNTKQTPSAPNFVPLMITRRCNLHCLHCSASQEQFLRKDMTTNELLSTIDELAAYKVFRIALTGGEPLIHPDFFVLANAVTKHPMRLQINTNATLVTSKVVDNLKQLRRPPFISVSLDGITAETYNRIRGQGSFIHMKRGIKRLTAAGLNVRPFVVLSRLNYQELPQIIEFANSLGVRQVTLSTPAACGRAIRYEKEMSLEPDLHRKILETVLAIDSSNPTLLDGPWLDLARLYHTMKEGKLQERKTSGMSNNCNGAWTKAAIASDGTVAPCDMAFTCRAGNVRDTSFIKIWRDSPVFIAIRKARGMPLSQVHGCENCSWHYICFGPCPAGNYSRTSIWPSSSPGCKVRATCNLVCNGTNRLIKEIIS